MKTIRFISVMLLTSVILFGFNACDDDNGGSSGGNTGKKLIKMVQEYDDITRAGEFAYSEGKLVKYITYYEGDSNDRENDLAISYNDNVVIVNGILDGGECNVTYTLNNKGLATSCIVKDENGDIDKEYTFDYSDGYLTRMSYSDSYGTETITFIYSNGNITKVNYKTKYDNESYTFTYSSQSNKGRIVCPILLDMLFENLPAYYAGILGKATANLPSSCIVKDNFETLSYTFSNTVDNDGYVKNTIIASDRENEVITYTFE